MKAGEEKDLPVFDPNRAGVIDILLGCIAKALTIQVKKKSNTGKRRDSCLINTHAHNIGNFLS